MVKNARKRQKTDKNPDSNDRLPLGSKFLLTDDASKDDEERRLESILFGVPFKPSGKSKENPPVISDEEDAQAGHLDGGKELENLLDSDLFFVDNNTFLSLKDDTATNAEAEDYEPEVEDQDLEAEDSQNHEKTQEADLSEQAPLSETAVLSTSRKPPAWVDPDDTNIKVSLASNDRLRKLRDAPSEDTLSGREYETRLRRQFQKINPTPEWASNARRKLHPTKRRRSSLSASENEDEEDVDVDVDGIVSELISSTAGISGKAKKARSLLQGTLSIERLRDANQAAPAEGEIRRVQFHPSPDIPVMFAASADRRLRLFHIDGLTNPHIQTLHIPSLPLTNAIFHPSGSSILMTGPRPFYYTYDLQTGTSQRSPRGLWGTSFTNSNRAAQDASMETCAFDSSGQLLAVAGRKGYIYLVDWISGAAQVVGHMKSNATVKSLWWSRNGSSSELSSLGEDSQVYVWDVGERKCIRRWHDEGGFGSRLLEGDVGGNYIATGSTTGLLNVYDASAISHSDDDKPKPLKTIGNLTTSITSMRFNHDSQLLAIASDVKKDQMRMIHLPSLTAFGNWPTSSTPLGHVTSIDFSVGSQYVGIGNNRGRVLLYQLRHFLE